MLSWVALSFIWCWVTLGCLIWCCYSLSCCPGLPYLVYGCPRMPYLPKNQIITGGWWWWWGSGVVVVWWCGGGGGYFTDYNTTLGLCWVALGCVNIAETDLKYCPPTIDLKYCPQKINVTRNLSSKRPELNWSNITTSQYTFKIALRKKYPFFCK
jgi:hypothetical protein